MYYEITASRTGYKKSFVKMAVGMLIPTAIFTNYCSETKLVTKN